MTNKCDQSWCPRTRYAKGYCYAHYKRVRAGRDMDMPFQRRGEYAEKFLERVTKSDGCWDWVGGKTEAGYGTMSHGEKSKLAHRLSYKIHVGPIPESMEVDHMCHNRGCVNPAHLRLATSGMNGQNRRGATSASKSGVRGVTWYGPRGKWMAKAQVAGKQYYLGYFETAKEAEAVVVAWRHKNMPYSINDQRGI